MLLSDVTANFPGKLLSDGEFSCIAFATEREQANFLTFLEKERFLDALDNPQISCVLITPNLAEKIPTHIQGVFVCENPKALLFEIHNSLAREDAYVGESFPTKIGASCNISPLSYVAPENVIIGDHVTIEPFAVVKGRVTIGNHVTIRSHATIGCKGFSFSKDENGNNISVIDTARIEIQGAAEVFEHASISAGIFPWEKTVIGANSKMDTNSFVAHGTKLGTNCLVVAGSVCCGNCTIGNNVWIGAGAVISNRIIVGDNARISLGAIVTKNVAEGETVSGNFAINHQQFLKNLKESLKE